MLISDLGLSIPCARISRLHNASQLPQICYVVECSIYHQPNTSLLKFGRSSTRNMPPTLTPVTFVTGRHFYRALPSSSSLRDAYRATETCEPQFGGKSSEVEITGEETQFNCFDEIDFEDDAEILRRRKIGTANKGKVPWNKGVKHTAETYERISKKTREALRDPKVRKKMTECPRAHSNQTKAKIGSALTRIWGDRLKEKRAAHNFFLSWVSSIAVAAKLGGSGEKELNWNSYEKIQRELAFQQFQWVADEVETKEMKRIRRQKKAQERAERQRAVQEMAHLNGQRKRLTRKKSKEEIEKLAVAEELKLKEKLTKMHRKKSTSGFASQDHRTWERLDLEVIKRDGLQTKVSLADQIRAVKNKRTLTDSSSIHLSSERLVE